VLIKILLKFAEKNAGKNIKVSVSCVKVFSIFSSATVEIAFQIMH